MIVGAAASGAGERHVRRGDQCESIAVDREQRRRIERALDRGGARDQRDRRANQKGGVGKTTTTVNLAAGAGAIGRRVLVVDLDPQGNATMGSGIDKRTLDPSVYDVLLENAAIAEARQTSPKAATTSSAPTASSPAPKSSWSASSGATGACGSALARVGDDYDFVLIDCPPSLSLLTLNGLAAAHGVVVPMQCEYFALEGLSDLVNTIRQVHANLNPQLEVIGLLRVMFDARITLQSQVSEQLKAHFGDKVFDTVIPRNVRLAEAPSYGMPGLVFDPASKGAQAFLDFAREMAARAEATHARRRRRRRRRRARMRRPAGPHRGRRHQRQRAARAALGRRLAGPLLARQGEARALHPAGRRRAAAARREARGAACRFTPTPACSRTSASRRSRSRPGSTPSWPPRHGSASTTPGSWSPRSTRLAGPASGAGATAAIVSRRSTARTSPNGSAWHAARRLASAAAHAERIRQSPVPYRTPSPFSTPPATRSSAARWRSKTSSPASTTCSRAEARAAGASLRRFVDACCSARRPGARTAYLQVEAATIGTRASTDGSASRRLRLPLPDAAAGPRLRRAG